MAVIQEGIIDNVVVQEVYSSERESTRAGGMTTTKHYILRNKQGGNKTAQTLEMDNAKAYATLQTFILTNMPSLVVNTNEGSILLHASRIRTEVDQNNYPVFKGSVTWEFDPRKPDYITQPITWSHKMTGGSRKVAFPIAPQRFYTKNGLVPIPYVGVNWDAEKRNYEAVDCYSPEWHMNAKQQLLASLVTPDYLLSLLAMSKTVNIMPFRGFPTGSVLYLGADIEETMNKNNKVCDLNHQFIIEPNMVNFTYAGIPVDNKEGHEYLWCASYVKGTVDNGAQAEVTQVNVAPMYGKSNFALLGLS